MCDKTLSCHGVHRGECRCETLNNNIVFINFTRSIDPLFTLHVKHVIFLKKIFSTPPLHPVFTLDALVQSPFFLSPPPPAARLARAASQVQHGR